MYVCGFVDSKGHHTLIISQGVVEPSISSSFTKEQWEEWLEKNLV
jgi:hypothetical protein